MLFSKYIQNRFGSGDSVVKNVVYLLWRAHSLVGLRKTSEQVIQYNVTVSKQKSTTEAQWRQSLAKICKASEKVRLKLQAGLWRRSSHCLYNWMGDRRTCQVQWTACWHVQLWDSVVHWRRVRSSVWQASTELKRTAGLLKLDSEPQQDHPDLFSDATVDILCQFGRFRSLNKWLSSSTS